MFEGQSTMRIRRLFQGLLALVVGLLGAGAGLAHADEAAPVRILLNWFAQADQAGYWQAQIDDLGKSAGLKITVLQGGPKIQTIPQVAAGQAEFGMGNADDILLARRRGAPVKAVFVALDYVPYTLVYHPASGIKTINDLKGKTIAVSIGFAYWEWLKKHYGLTGMREIPVSGDLSLFRSDMDMVQQGYSIFLPYRMDDAGIPNAQFKVAALGYRPYDVMFTTDELLQKQPKLARAAIAAVKQGWINFMKDPAKVKPLMMSLNTQIPPDVHDKAVSEMIADLLPHDTAKVGCMNDARWDELADRLREVDLLPANFDVKQAYDKSLVPGC
jgi:NitT/TauT family transport system substrate-binding protein